MNLYQTVASAVGYTGCSALLVLCMLLQSAPASAQPGIAETEVPDELRNLLLEAVSSSDSFDDRFEAEVWLLDMSTRLSPYVTDTRERLNILKAVHYEATRAQLHPELVLAVIDTESRFDRFAISRAGALGLMQVMPFWLQELKRPDDNLFDITTNLRLGCTILKYYLDKSGGDLRTALTRYNGSMGKRKYPDKVFTALSEKWFQR
jgi:soluble lytic murein transglycosylase-like protein